MAYIHTFLCSQMDLSHNELCGVDQFGYGYTADGIKAISDALRVNAELTSVWTPAHSTVTSPISLL